MDKNISPKTLNLIGSLVLLVFTVVGFFWLWNSAQPIGNTNTAVDQKYKKIEIGSVKVEAQNLVKDKDNLSGMPLQTPADASLGRTNPFAGL